MRQKPTIQEIRAISSKIKTSKDLSYLKDSILTILLYIEHELDQSEKPESKNKKIEDKIDKLNKKTEVSLDKIDQNFKNIEKFVKSLKYEIENIKRLKKILG